MRFKEREKTKTVDRRKQVDVLMEKKLPEIEKPWILQALPILLFLLVSAHVLALVLFFSSCIYLDRDLGIGE